VDHDQYYFISFATNLSTF